MPTNIVEKQQAIGTFVFWWIALALFSFLFFRFSANVKLKKILHPLLAVGGGAAFALFAAWNADWRPIVVATVFPMVALITFLNLRKTRFCAGCGRTLSGQPIFPKPGLCPHCGGEIEENKATGTATQTSPPPGRLDRP